MAHSFDGCPVRWWLSAAALALLTAAPAAAQYGGGSAASASSAVSGGTRSTVSASTGSPAPLAAIAAPASVAGASSSRPFEAAFPAKSSLKAPDFSGSKASAPSGRPGESARVVVAALRPLGDVLRADVREKAESSAGIPYRPGGRDPAQGLDSAGYIWHVFRSIHREVPDDPEAQQRMGTRLPADQFVERGRFRDDARLRAGDVLFFRVAAKDGSDALRPTLYCGEGRVAYASPARGRVVVEDVRAKARALMFVQRVLP